MLKIINNKKDAEKELLESLSLDEIQERLSCELRAINPNWDNIFELSLCARNIANKNK